MKNSSNCNIHQKLKNLNPKLKSRHFINNILSSKEEMLKTVKIGITKFKENNAGEKNKI